MTYDLIAPQILKETAAGMQRYSILDQMLANRQIECTGEITAASVNALIRQIRYLAQEDPSAPITLYINSPGGEVTSGLALYDVMQAVPCPIRTVCTGTAASMAAVLFAAGSQRDMLPHAEVMIHDPLMQSCSGGSALQMKSLGDRLMRTRRIIGQVLAEHTHHPLEEIYEKTCQDSFFGAEEAVAFGLADRIITQL